MRPIGTSHSRGRTLVGSVFVTGALALGVFALPAGQGVAAQSTPPGNTAEPTIGGRAEQGRTLTSSTGSWTGTQPLAFAYQWVRCGADGGRPDGGDCTIISGATDRRYRVARADVGFRLRVRVTATNAEGSRTAASNPTATVGGAPVNTSVPSVRGNMVAGSLATADPGPGPAASRSRSRTGGCAATRRVATACRSVARPAATIDSPRRMSATAFGSTSLRGTP